MWKISRAIFKALLGKRLPLTQGNFRVSGLKGEVEIWRDRSGIPHIYADSEDDGWFGLGFCQGQDRFFQIEAWIRVVEGRLSEWAGEKTLPIDRLSRRVGLVAAARSQFQAMNPEMQNHIIAFATGANAGVKIGLERFPHEYSLLRSEPLEMLPEHSLGILAMMSFLLPTNWDSEIARYKILNSDGPDALHAINPHFPAIETGFAEPYAGRAMERLAEEMAIVESILGATGGSNNWVVGAGKTKSGRPILANDPHLGPLLPPHWYLAHVKTNAWEVAGGCLAGTPGFACGHNGHSAWGMTAGIVDNTDLFLEKVGPDGKSIWDGKQFVPCPVRREVIRVKGKPDVVENVLITPRGPIVSPEVGDGEIEVSLSGTWLRPQAIRGVLEVHKARSFSAFRESFRDWGALSLNYVYADTKNQLGWQLVGLPPRRKQGNGLLPLPGWGAETGWEETLADFDDMPYLENPKCGYLATANSRPHGGEAKAFLGEDWFDHYRLHRIEEVLREKNDWDLEATQNLQLDELSIPWREIKSKVLGIVPREGRAAEMHQILERWNGKVEAGSSGATVYELFLAKLLRRVVYEKAPQSAAWLLGTGFGGELVGPNWYGARRQGWFVELVKAQPEHWWKNSDWKTEITLALEAAGNTLHERFGVREENWEWGKVRPLRLKHFMGQVPLLAPVFNREPLYWGGDSSTIAQTSVDPGDPLRPPLAAANLRLVFDVGIWENSRVVLAGGQSGNPLSPHYDDLLKLWLKGESVPLHWKASDIKVSDHAKVTLLPER